MIEYRHRCVEKSIQSNLAAFGAVLIAGPKWCGKTTTARQFAKSEILLNDPRQKKRYVEIADIDISILLQGDHPRLIDEWQIIPELWDAIRYVVDDSDQFGQYVLTGSNSVDWSKIDNSGAGRIVILKMYPMSLFESGYSGGEVSISQLFDGVQEIFAESKLTIADVAHQLVRGGWPKTVGEDDSVVRMQISGYCNTLLNTDISSIDGKKRDPQRMRMVLQALARNESTEAPNTVILNDVTSGGAYSMHINTLDDYLNALRLLYVIEDLPAWCPHLRSATAIRTTPVRHFTDPSIGAYFLHASADDLLNDPETFGLFFESLVVRDLRAYASAMNGEVLHYRDGDGLEADAIIHLDNGEWAAFEMKLGMRRIDEGAQHLLKLAEKVDPRFHNPPRFLAVITGAGTAFRRKDGVFVIPIGCLRD